MGRGGCCGNTAGGRCGGAHSYNSFNFILSPPPATLFFFFLPHKSNNINYKYKLANVSKMWIKKGVGIINFNNNKRFKASNS
jgi:hypothetical protein